MKKVSRAWAVTALVLSGCATTQSPDGHRASVVHAGTVYPDTGVESVAGEWSGTWKGLTGRATLRVDAPSADDIEVEYCYDAWCVGGCSKEPCGWYANEARDVRFENEQLKFTSRGAASSCSTAREKRCEARTRGSTRHA